ncbi:unnamed protein product [Alternaria alternata]
MEVFRDYVVAKAMKHTYLMDIILAFTSLHSASKATEASSSHEHVAAALHYQNQSIAEFNETQSLVKLSEENLDPVCLMTALHAVTALVASLTPATPGEQLEPIAGIIMRIRKYALCLNNMINEHRVWANNSEFKRILDSPTVLRIEDDNWFSADKMRELTNTILANMDLDDRETPFFRSTLEKLEKSYADNNGRSVISWLVMLSKTKTWFAVPLVIGAVFESLGYAARAYGHSHPSSKNAYIVQTMLILLAPILSAATIYMFMGRLVLASGYTKASIIRPTWLTKIFLGGDILCFLVQAAGASFLVKTDASQSTKNLGKYIILAGLVIQLIVFGFFLVVAAIFHLRAGKAERLEIGTVKMFNWQKYMVTLYIVSGLVTVRNIFRVAEYVTGDQGYLLTHEWPIYIFDALLMAAALASCTSWYVGDIVQKTFNGDEEDSGVTAIAMFALNIATTMGKNTPLVQTTASRKPE